MRVSVWVSLHVPWEEERWRYNIVYVCVCLFVSLCECLCLYMYYGKERAEYILYVCVCVYVCMCVCVCVCERERKQIIASEHWSESTFAVKMNIWCFLLNRWSGFLQSLNATRHVIGLNGATSQRWGLITDAYTNKGDDWKTLWTEKLKKFLFGHDN